MRSRSASSPTAASTTRRRRRRSRASASAAASVRAVAALSSRAGRRDGRGSATDGAGGRRSLRPQLRVPRGRSATAWAVAGSRARSRRRSTVVGDREHLARRTAPRARPLRGSPRAEVLALGRPRACGSPRARRPRPSSRRPRAPPPPRTTSRVRPARFTSCAGARGPRSRMTAARAARGSLSVALK